MPTYAYACTQCGHRFDTVQSFTDDALANCPECSGRLRKMFSSVGVVFKGSGFYRTDSRTVSDKKSENTQSEAKKEATKVKPESTKSSTVESPSVAPAKPAATTTSVS